MTIKLVGADDTTGSSIGSNYISMARFKAVASGNMTEFRIKSNASGNVKCALYADNNGEPGSLITAMNTGQAVVGGQWNILNFNSTPITQDVYYWLAINSDTTGAGLYASIGTLRYKAATYSGFSFPDPAGSGYSSGNYYDLFAGWGEPAGGAAGHSLIFIIG